MESWVYPLRRGDSGGVWWKGAVEPSDIAGNELEQFGIFGRVQVNAMMEPVAPLNFVSFRCISRRVVRGHLPPPTDNVMDAPTDNVMDAQAYHRSQADKEKGGRELNFDSVPTIFSSDRSLRDMENAEMG